MAELNTRAALKTDFLKRTGWSDADIRPLAGDASNRTYERLRHTGGQPAVLMDAPPDKGEDVGAFVGIARYLTGTGLSAPEILEIDEQNGFLLIEDLGDDLYARCLAQNSSLNGPLYDAAVDVLTHLHRHDPPAGLSRYDADRTVPLACLAYDWYVPGVIGSSDPEGREAFARMADALLRPFDTDCQVLIQRDYHAENLLWLPERQGVARVGLLDFQNAELGHPVYDLVSVLQDARRDVGRQTEQAMKERFLAYNAFDRDEFERAYAVFGLQRNLRILGVFARLCLRDGKAHYVDLIPRVWGHIQTCLRHPDLHDIANLLSENLPAPDRALLATLKSQVAA
ncbi:phosphotransferase [uncultured Roseobacter sp.]|uniref:aminoglycoside phosphotransferase family protein n=1 Tax=uncultured Roseobacter sp. TaxID=114847 RepID=UPI00261C1F19|nr:phosphotransferase [uncultured Roseobacter sp.]